MTRHPPHSAMHGRVPADLRLAMRVVLGGAAMLALCDAALAGSTVSVRLEGDIAPECSLAAGPAGPIATAGLPIDIGDVTRPGSRNYAFALNCNAPFGYRLEAQYGALTNAAAGPVPSGFTAAVPYDVAVHIPIDGPSIDDRCAGDTIRAGRVSCPFSTSGNNIALGSQAQLTITWMAPGEMPLAGAYVERLTVMVATSL
jgi:hypothetical protein